MEYKTVNATDNNKLNLNKVIIYTDGACRGNPGVGGWGALMIFGTNHKEIYGCTTQTTNNRMELMAAIEALKHLKRPCLVDLYTDSKYVKDGVSAWLEKWKKNNWRTAAKNPVKNQDLWMALDQICSQHKVNWYWVKGHQGNEGNEKADQLANQAIDEMISANN